MEDVEKKPEAQEIPQEHIDFLQAVAVLAKAHGVRELNVSFRMSSFIARDKGYRSWDEEIRAVWTRGRHSEPSTIHFSSTRNVHGKV